MQKIAIIDDNEAFCISFQNMIEEYAASENKDIEIYLFHSGEKFCNHWQKFADFELLFIDIELPMMNGVEIGKFIREHEMNGTIPIVFISAKESYAMQLFRYHPFDFLVKPVSSPDLKYCLDHFYRMIPCGRQFFHYRSSRKQFAIETSRILYFESSRKHILMFTTGSSVPFIGKLDDVEKELENSRFLRIHQSYLVNMDHISDLKYDSLTISNGNILQISRAYRDIVRSRFMHGQVQRMKRGIKNENNS